MMLTNRRQFLTLAGGAGAAAALDPRSLFAAPKPESFDFLFITDAHLQPELNAAGGTGMCFKKARNEKVAFAIQGGDHVFDTMAASKERSTMLWDLYGKTEQDLGLKVFHTCGNHDCFGISSNGATASTDPEYGKKMFIEKFGPANYSFDQKGVHFVVLDSVRPLGNGEGYDGFIDEAQLAWLKDDLAKQPAGTPVIVTTHIPLVTAFDNYTPTILDGVGTRGKSDINNSAAVIRLFEGHNVIGVLQGHTHIWETVTWRGVPYVTGGAVSGNWWRGTRMGTPEGYTVVSVRDGKMSARYETYGFQSVSPNNT